jgi:dGTPase
MNESPRGTKDTSERERALLAPYAMHSVDSAGRRYNEAAHPYRGPYQRDRDRIVHSAAFRRLSQKTQVFTGELGDYHRTRLTHTLEVASIARTLARALQLNEDLVEALALAHDLGHPPFGHSGEQILDECLQELGGFNHNAQALRICEVLETRYPDFPGLNLTAEVLEGQRRRAEKGQRRARSEERGGEMQSSGSSAVPPDSPLLEVQVVDAADSIAYDAHDADDALEIGILELQQLLAIPLWLETRERIGRRFRNLDDRQLRRAIVHEVIDREVSDVLATTQRRIAELGLASIEDVRRAPVVVGASSDLSAMKTELEGFLFAAVYHHPAVLARRQHAQQALRDSFGILAKNDSILPSKFRGIAETEGIHRAVADYLAGMTDRFALDEHRRLTIG